MKALVLLACALLSACAMTPEQLRTTYHATKLVDAGTTMARDPACMSEGNPMLGRNPTDQKVLAYVAAQMLIYEGIYHYLKHKGDESERLAFGRVFAVVAAVGPVNNAYQLARGCD